jgi:Radical SAM superfamily/4Fe-4S single cluster domain
MDIRNDPKIEVGNMSEISKSLLEMPNIFYKPVGLIRAIWEKYSYRFNYKSMEMHHVIRKFSNIAYKPNHHCIEIDITYACNLRCYNCNRSSTQLPAGENISVEQIEKFVAESKQKNRKWKKIRILGGEPTLHPHIFDILDVLLSYKKDFYSKTKIILVSNGYGEKVNQVLEQIPKGITIENSAKQSPIQFFATFNVAPADLEQYADADYSRGCPIPRYCGIGLNRYGYYPCSVGGGIDRVAGFGIGRSSLPDDNDDMKDELRMLCRNCGHFKWDNSKNNQEVMSESWKEIYERSKRKKPVIPLY